VLKGSLPSGSDPFSIAKSIDPQNGRAYDWLTYKNTI
jgi:hypothetical protein